MHSRLGFLRTRNAIAAGALAGLVAACGFGVDLDGIFGSSGGVVPGDGGADAASDVASDSTIPKVQVLQIGVGDQFGCGRRADGTVMCWGNGAGGRLGDGQSTSSSKPVLVREVNDAIDISVGYGHACAVRRDNTVVCWGQNERRQVGDGSTTAAPSPRAVVGLTDATQVAAGGEFTCALKKDATVHCWGENSSGQLGDNMTVQRGNPAAVIGLADVTQIAVSYSSACALASSGDVFCWGENADGAVGNGASGADVLAPVKIAELTGVASLGQGSAADHFCAVLASGAARCWGNADSGEIGHAKGEDLVNKPTAVVDLADAAKISMGGSFTCALRKTGGVACWGSNGWRQLGIGDANPPGGTNTPVPLDTLTTGIDQIAAGLDLACALFTGGERISCWGANRSGALGRDSRLASAVPLEVNGFSAAHVGLGREHTCATTPQGAIWCWGLNNFRQQASTAFLVTGTPTMVTAVTGAQRVAGGEIHTCALFGSELKCWGHGGDGALGNGATPYQEPDPVVFAAGTGVKDVGAGYHFTCAILANDQVACTGLNDDGRLGSAGGNASTPRIIQVPNPALNDAGAPDANDEAGVDAGPPPPAMIPFANVAKLAIGRIHSCALHGGGKVSCWGSPGDGRLGINTTTPRSSPLLVNLPKDAIDVAAGFDHSCAVLADGTVRCWGANYSGQLSGGGDNGAALRTPNLNGKQAKAITAGGAHTCAILTDGSAVCWGRGKEGQLGTGFLADANQPTAVKDLAGVTMIEANDDRTCAIVTDGSLYCWGDNGNGGLGDGVLMVTGTPDAVLGY